MPLRDPREGGVPRIVVAGPRYKREIYHDHGNGLMRQDQTYVLIICEPLLLARRNNSPPLSASPL
jgi:hypothetical protein